MSEKVAITYVGGQGPSVDVPNPSGFTALHTDVNIGDSIEVPAELAKSLCEQESNWTLTKAEKPKASEKDGK